MYLNSSTHLGGIYPIRLVNAANSSSTLDTLNTEPFPPAGTSSNISMSQQGVTVTVSCQNQQLDVNSDPPLQRFAEPAEVSPAEVSPTNQMYSYTALSVATTCNGQTLTSSKHDLPIVDGVAQELRPGVQISNTNNTVFALICPETNDAGTTTYSKSLH